MLRFRYGRPGVKWVRGFYKLHTEALKYEVPDIQEAKRFAAVNSQTLNTHFAALDALRLEYNIDSDRVWNLDETGCSPGKDKKGKLGEKSFLRIGAHTDLRLVEFSYSHRVTMMGCVSAGGAAGPPLFVFKGSRLPYRVIVKMVCSKPRH